MPQPVAGVATVQLGEVPIEREQRLDLSLPERAVATLEEWILRGAAKRGGVAPEESSGRREERLLGPRPALQAFDDDPGALEVDVAAGEKPNLSHPQAVVVDQRKERAVAEACDRPKEGAKLDLGEVTGQALAWPEDAGQRWDEVRK